MIISCDIGHPTPKKLRICTDLLVALNLDFLKRLRKSKRIPSLYGSGVRYRREPRRMSGRGVEQFAPIPVLLRTRYGDCEDLAAWRVAELRLRGVRAIPWIIRPHSRVYHVQVKHPDGTIEDPSRKLGMRGAA